MLEGPSSHERASIVDFLSFLLSLSLCSLFSLLSSHLSPLPLIASWRVCWSLLSQKKTIHSHLPPLLSALSSLLSSLLSESLAQFISSFISLLSYLLRDNWTDSNHPLKFSLLSPSKRSILLSSLFFLLSPLLSPLSFLNHSPFPKAVAASGCFSVFPPPASFCWDAQLTDRWKGNPNLSALSKYDCGRKRFVRNDYNDNVSRRSCCT